MGSEEEEGETNLNNNNNKKQQKGEGHNNTNSEEVCALMHHLSTYIHYITFFINRWVVVIWYGNLGIGKKTNNKMAR
jgi:hypothetical protein